MDCIAPSYGQGIGHAWVDQRASTSERASRNFPWPA
jgi:hypothetical protein